METSGIRYVKQAAFQGGDHWVRSVVSGRCCCLSIVDCCLLIVVVVVVAAGSLGFEGLLMCPLFLSVVLASFKFKEGGNFHMLIAACLHPPALHKWSSKISPLGCHVGIFGVDNSVQIDVIVTYSIHLGFVVRYPFFQAKHHNGIFTLLTPF